MPKPVEERITARIKTADGNSITFTANGSVVGGMVEVLSWLPAERRVKALARLQAMHEQRLKVEAERAAPHSEGAEDARIKRGEG